MRYCVQNGVILENGESLSPTAKRHFIIGSLKSIIDSKIEKNGKSRIGIGNYDRSNGADNLRLYMPEIVNEYKELGYTVASYQEPHCFIYLIAN